MLAFVAAFSKALGLLTAVIGVLAEIGMVLVGVVGTSSFGFAGPFVGFASISVALAIMAFFLLMGIGIVAGGEWIYLHLAIEANSRTDHDGNLLDRPLR